MPAPRRPIPKPFRARRLPAGGGFTVTELLVSITAVTILCALLYPLAQNAIASGKRASGTNGMRQIGVAFHSYAADHAGEFPYWPNPSQTRPRANSTGNSAGLPSLLIPNYLPNNDVFFAPADTIRWQNRDPLTGWAREPGGKNADRHSYYLYYMNPSPEVLNSEQARPMSEGGYGPIWSVRNPASKIIANSVYYDHLHPVYRDGAMILRIDGSVQWYPNGTFKRNRSIINQFGQRD